MKGTFRRAAVIVAGILGAAGGVVGAAPAALAPDPAILRSGADRDLLAAAGLYGAAEHEFRAALARGDSTARGPMLRVLLATERAGEALRLLDSWGGAAALGEEGARFTAARVHEAAGDREGALAAYLDSASREPLLSDHAAFRAGQVLQTLDRPDDAVAQFESAADAARTRRLAALAAFRAAGIAAARGNRARARELLDRVPPRSVVARVDRYDLEASLARADSDSAAERRALWVLVDASPSADAALRATERLAQLSPPTLADRVAFARVALAGKQYGRAAEHLDAALELLRKTPDPARETEVRLLRGRAAMGRREYTSARAEFARLPAGATRNARGEAALESARCLWRLGRIDACLVEYDSIACGAFVDSVRALAAFEAAREARDDDRFDEAARRFAGFRTAWPRHELADDAAWFEARALADGGRPAAALDVLVELRRLYPDSERREEASYWTALAHRDAGDPQAACHDLAFVLQEYPDGYWAGRAAILGKALGCGGEVARVPPERDPIEWLHSVLHAPDVPETARVHAILSSESFRRARELASLGLRDDAEAELSGLRRTADADAGQLLALAQAAWSIGVPREAMRAASILKRRAGGDVLSGSLPPAVARLLYPVAHLDSVRRWAAANEVDPLFVYAVMREESWLDPGAVSGAGARGLLQIMPATGYDLAVRAGLRDFSADALFEPDVNIRLGTRYLRELLAEMDGEPLLALAAYNAGKRNALRWRGKGGEFDADRYVAGITYRETNGYVQKVLRSYAIYRALWGDVLGKLPPAGARNDG